MNDGLAELQKRLEQRLPTDYGLVQDILADLRAWLALPPSEEEIAAGGKTLHDADCPCEAWPCELEIHGRRNLAENKKDTEAYREMAERVIVASRAVLARPPEVEKGTS